MQIDGPCPKFTAPRAADLRSAAPRKKRAEKNHGGAQTVHQLLGDLASGHGRGVNHQRFAVHFNAASQICKYINCRMDVIEPWAVFYDYRSAGHHGGGKQGQNPVF